MPRHAIPLLFLALICTIVQSQYIVLEKGDEDKVSPEVMKKIKEYVKSKKHTIVDKESPEASYAKVVGDLLVEEKDLKIFFSDPQARKGITVRDNMWPREDHVPTVPYVNLIKKKKYPDFAKLLNKAMMEWEAHTCIRFRPRKKTDLSFIKIYLGDGCHSRLGRSFIKGIPHHQFLSLGEGCHFVGTIIHELAHALGMLHEQMRADRDDYLMIMMEYVNKNMISNFDKITTSNFSDYGVPYDYTSIMHYDPIAFTTEGAVTMRTRDPQYQGLIGSSEVLSHRDKLIANIMYDCLDDWLLKCGIDENPCEGEGYIGADCNCVCPPGRQGDKCQTVVGTYYSQLLPDCSRVITENGTTFATSENKELLPNGKWCVFQIHAPDDHNISVVFNDFRLDQVQLSGPNHCVVSYLVFMMDNAQDVVVCGKDVARGDTFNFNTNNLTMFLNHIIGFYATGFEATVYFYPINSTDSMKIPSPPVSDQADVPSDTIVEISEQKSPPLGNTSEVMLTTPNNVLISNTETQFTTVNPITNMNEIASSPSKTKNEPVSNPLASKNETLSPPPDIKNETASPPPRKLNKAASSPSESKNETVSSPSASKNESVFSTPENRNKTESFPPKSKNETLSLSLESKNKTESSSLENKTKTASPPLESKNETASSPLERKIETASPLPESNKTSFSPLENKNKTSTPTSERNNKAAFPPLESNNNTVSSPDGIKNTTTQSEPNSTCNLPGLDFFVWLLGMLTPILWTWLTK